MSRLTDLAKTIESICNRQVECREDEILWKNRFQSFVIEPLESMSSEYLLYKTKPEIAMKSGTTKWEKASIDI